MSDTRQGLLERVPLFILTTTSNNFKNAVLLVQTTMVREMEQLPTTIVSPKIGAMHHFIPQMRNNFEVSSTN